MKCRHCQSALSLTFLDLGSAPPSNAYLSEEGLRAPETWLPLRLLTCETCWLVQTEDHAGREALFTPDYAYFSSFSSTWLAHSRAFVASAVARFGLNERSLVCEVGANDGYLLQYVKEAGIPCYGVEPTASTAAAARSKGLDVVERFFGAELAGELAAAGRQGDLVTASNVLAHVPDINDFVRGFTLLLKPRGVAIFEFPHLLRMVQEAQFDTAYHEHYSYLSLTSARRILEHGGLAVFDVEQHPTHGGSLRVFAQRRDSGARDVSERVAAVLRDEAQAGLATPAPYAGFQARADRIADDFTAFLLEARRAGKSVAACGAAAKGSTLLNYAGVRRRLLAFVVDGNPAKQGRYMPGSRIPIVAESRLDAERPDYIVLLPWNLRQELMGQFARARSWGAQFVTAVPELRVVA